MVLKTIYCGDHDTDLSRVLLIRECETLVYLWSDGKGTGPSNHKSHNMVIKLLTKLILNRMIELCEQHKSILGRPMHNWTKVHLNRLYKTSKYYQKTMKMHMCYLWYMFIILTKLDVVTCHTFEMGGTRKCQIIQFSTLSELQPKIRSHHI